MSPASGLFEIVEKEMASNKTDLCVGEKVRVVSVWSKTLSHTLYEIVEMNYEPTGYRCMIREVNEVNPGVKYRAQEFDVSLLARA